MKNISYQFRNNNFFRSKIAAVLISIILIVNTIMFFPHFFRDTYIVTISNKRIIRSDNINKYIIYAQMEDGNMKVFEDENSLVELKFNSEDLYWGLAINKKYEISAYGFTMPLLPYYQNIINVKAVQTERK